MLTAFATSQGKFCAVLHVLKSALFTPACRLFSSFLLLPREAHYRSQLSICSFGGWAHRVGPVYLAATGGAMCAHPRAAWTCDTNQDQNVKALQHGQRISAKINTFFSYLVLPFLITPRIRDSLSPSRVSLLSKVSHSNLSRTSSVALSENLFILARMQNGGRRKSWHLFCEVSPEESARMCDRVRERDMKRERRDEERNGGEANYKPVDSPRASPSLCSHVWSRPGSIRGAALTTGVGRRAISPLNTVRRGISGWGVGVVTVLCRTGDGDRALPLGLPQVGDAGRVSGWKNQGKGILSQSGENRRNKSRMREERITWRVRAGLSFFCTKIVITRCVQTERDLCWF